MISEFTPNAQTINDVVTNFGCLAVGQAAMLLGNEDTAIRNGSFLILKRCIRQTGNTYVPRQNPKVDRLMLDCLWVALNRAKDENGNVIREEILNAFPNKPVQVNMIHNNKYYNITGITTENVGSTLPFLDQRYKKNYKDKTPDNMEYIFVVRNEDLIDAILDFGLEMPFRIVLLDGEPEAEPRIRYLKM